MFIIQPIKTQLLSKICVIFVSYEYSHLNNLKAIQPDIHIESTSHIGNSYLKDLRKVFSGRIVMLPYYTPQSSTAIKNKMKNNDISPILS